MQKRLLCFNFKKIFKKKFPNVFSMKNYAHRQFTFCLRILTYNFHLFMFCFENQFPASTLLVAGMPIVVGGESHCSGYFRAATRTPLTVARWPRNFDGHTAANLAKSGQRMFLENVFRECL